MLKATSVNRYGAESHPTSIEVNESGYVELPEDPDAISYNLYAPLAGFEGQGPWYFVRAYSRREARQARFTVSALTKDRDLVAKLCRGALDTLNPPYVISLPPPVPEQTHWMIYGGPPNYTPYAIVECPSVH